MGIQLRQLTAEINYMRLLFTSFVLLAALAGAAGTYAVRHQFVLGGQGGWDYLTVDSDSNRLFIARADRVLVMASHPGRVYESA